MQFKPKTQEEIDADGLIAKGDYPATILLCEEQTSRAEQAKAQSEGREPESNMFKVKVGVYATAGDRQEWITDYIMSDSGKLKQFAEACGLGDSYQKGTLEAEQFDGRDLIVKVGIEKPKPKDKADPDGEKWPAKNRIDAYVSKDAKPADDKKAKDEDDDIPWG